MWIETKVSLDKTYLCLNIDESPNIDAFRASAHEAGFRDLTLPLNSL